MKIIRVFPRRTSATPTDSLVRVNVEPDMLDEADEIHVSVTFTWDIPRAEQLARAWRDVATTTIGGPACGDRGGNFIPGRYIADGYTITSRGCNNRCWYCQVHKREGAIRELPIIPGSNVLDSNLLQCSHEHISSVFAMLRGRPNGKVRFTGGLEASRITPEIATELRKIHPAIIYCANDRPGDVEKLRCAATNLFNAGFTKASHRLAAYVFLGYKGDTIEKAEARLRETWDAGFVPFAMLMRCPLTGLKIEAWQKFTKQWIRPVLIFRNLKIR